MSKPQESSASHEGSSQESLQIVSEILSDVVDEVVDNISSDLIITKAKKNIASEIKRSPQKYLQKAIDENPQFLESYQKLKICETKLNFFNEAKKRCPYLGKRFAESYLGRSSQTETASEDAALIAVWKEYDKEYANNAFWNFFKKQFEKLPEEEKTSIREERYRGWESQNSRIASWMLRELETVTLKDKTTLGTEDEIRSSILEAETQLSQVAGENSEIDLLLKIRSGQGDVDFLSEQVAELRFQNFKEARRIVWASVGKKEAMNEDGELIEISDFKYPGKTAAKTVYIPYHDIQQAIIDANWTLRAGKGINSDPSDHYHVKGNYLTTHMLFVVSDEQHIKTSSTGKYDGGRSFIDFPIVLPLDLMTTQRIFANQEAFENFLSSQGSQVGRNASSSVRYSHSEWKLEEFLQDSENIRKIVQILKTKLTAKFGTAEDHKVYELILFTNSNQNICDQHEQHEFGCEGKMWNIEASTLQGSFLEKITTEMHNQGLKTSSKHLPRILIANTSFERFRYASKSSESLSQDAQDWFAYEPSQETIKRKELSIDAKKLAGSVMLSSAEKDIDGRDRYRELMKSVIESEKDQGSGGGIVSAATEYSDPESIPFYSGFTSKAGSTDLLGYEKRRGKIETPKSFDGADLIEVKSKPSKSPALQDLSQFASMNLSGKVRK